MEQLERKFFKLNSFLRSQLPASVAEDIIRKLTFVYYLNSKMYSKHSLESFYSIVDKLIYTFEHREVFFDDEPLHEDYFSFRANIYSSKDEVIEILNNVRSDFNFYFENKSGSSDLMEVTYLFNDFNDQELLEIINMTFENSVRDESTPESITELVLKLFAIYKKGNEMVTDMTCGNGTFLLEASKHFKRVEGIEINRDNASIARLRLIVNQIHGEIRQANCFEDSWHHQVSSNLSDLVFAEFPWKMIVKDPRLKDVMFNCNANRLMLNYSSSTDFFFLSAMMNYLKRDGVAITVMPLSTLSNLADKPVREHIIKRGFLREVIALPTNIFGRTGVSTAIVVMGLQPCDKVSFFDGSQYFIQEKRKINTIDVEKLLCDLAKAKESGECYVSKEEMEKHDYSFSPSHYLKNVETTIPNATELNDLAEIFTGWQVASAKLEAIHKNDGNGTRLLQMSNVENGRIVSDFKRYDIPTNTIERFKLQKGDVVISTKSLKVKSAVFDLYTEEPFVAAGSIMVIRPKDEKLDPYYLVAYFESDLGKQVLEMYQTGNIIPNLTINSVKKILVPGLPYEEQSRIGRQYMDLRDLIWSEKERLKALESKASKILDNLWDTKEGE